MLTRSSPPGFRRSTGVTAGAARGARASQRSRRRARARRSRPGRCRTCAPRPAAGPCPRGRARQAGRCPGQAGDGSTARRPESKSWSGAVMAWRSGWTRTCAGPSGGCMETPGIQRIPVTRSHSGMSMSVDAPTWIARTPPPRARNARMLASADAWAAVTGPAAALTITRSTLRRSTSRSSTSSAISTSWPRLPAMPRAATTWRRTDAMGRRTARRLTRSVRSPCLPARSLSGR